MKISFYTLGCKLNQAETEELKKEAQKLGFLAVPFKTKADITVVRACGVTCGASRTTREMIRSAKRRGAYVIVVGCLENKNMSEIDFVAKDNEEVIRHLQLSQRFLVVPNTRDSLGMTVGTASVILSEAKNPYNYTLRDPSVATLPQDNNAKVEPTNRTRAFIKIQTGCNYNCAYCAIPSFRGHSTSIPATEVIKKIKQAEKEGYKEVTLTGVNICLYKEGTIDLAELLKRILAETKIPRIRLGSLDPRLISNELIKLYSPQSNVTMKQCNNDGGRLLPHWHLSLQSGSNELLKNMRRGYTTKQYENIVKKIRRNNSLFSLTTDIIVGFPGETETNFKETCDFIQKIKFTKVHIFPFSPRPGTPAAQMTDTVQDKIKTERVKKIIKIADKTSREFIKKFVSQTRPVLFEHKKSALWSGYTPEYFIVKYKSTKNLQNKIAEVKIISSRVLQ